MKNKNLPIIILLIVIVVLSGGLTIKIVTKNDNKIIIQEKGLPTEQEIEDEVLNTQEETEKKNDEKSIIQEAKDNLPTQKETEDKVINTQEETEKKNNEKNSKQETNLPTRQEIEDKALSSQEEMEKKNDRESILLAITMVKFGKGSTLTYDNFNEQLKEQLGYGNYNLTGPNSSGNFSLIINGRTYTIDSNGNIIE